MVEFWRFVESKYEIKTKQKFLNKTHVLVFGGIGDEWLVGRDRDQRESGRKGSVEHEKEVAGVEHIFIVGN